MVNIGYRAARMQGYFQRSLYSRLLPLIVSRPIAQTRKVPVAVYSLSCERDFPEQIACIRSFIRCVGIPEKFVVVSDGSYSANSCQLLRQINTCVDVIDIENLITNDLPKVIVNYARHSPMGKKLVVELTMPIAKASIYVDSDVLFFPGAEKIASLSASNAKEPHYLPDCAAAFDDRILHHATEKVNPVNGGFILLKSPLNWEKAIERLEQLKELPNYFTEQTMLHLTMHQNQAISLCSHKFILSRNDEFIYPDKYASNKIALRHYVSPVRHKFWLSKSIFY